MRTDYSTWGGKPRRSLQILPMIVAHGDSDECLPWPYKCTRDGYGKVQHEDGKEWRVSRLAFKLAKPDEFDPSLFVLHSCDNPPCFSMKHLFQGTQADNMDDMARKGRKRNVEKGTLNPANTGEGNGNAKLNADTVRLIRQRWAAGEEQQSIAMDLSISKMLVSLIVRRLAWKHVC